MRSDGDGVARRVYLLMVALTGAGVAGCWFAYGIAGAAGFGAGSMVSFANAYWMHRIVRSVGDPDRKPSKPSIVLALFRYILILLLLYGILKFSETGFLTALAGCFVHIAAVALEVVYEITYGTS